MTSLSSAPAQTVSSTRVPRTALLAGGVLTAILVWVFWPSLRELAHTWSHDAKYSHGYLVPVFAAYLLWTRLRQAQVGPVTASWWGVPVLLVGLALRGVGTLFYFSWFSDLSLLPLLAGIVLLVGGWPALRLSWPALLFLVFMFPLPFQLERALSNPLQRIGTVASAYALQTIGYAAHSEGNVIFLKQFHIGVIEACNGLSMLMIFFALSTAVALLTRRPLVDRLVILLSAVPIALVCNIIRITVTGVLYVVAGQRLAELVFHDLAGWLMMPLALGFLWLELIVLSWVVVERVRPFPVRVVNVYPDRSREKPTDKSADKSRAQPASAKNGLLFPSRR